MGTVGTFATLGLSKLFKRNKVLEYIGRNSLVFYLFHFYLLYALIRPLAPVISMLDGNYVASVAMYLVSWISVTFLCYPVAQLINKHCPWLIGKGL